MYNALWYRIPSEALFNLGNISVYIWGCALAQVNFTHIPQVYFTHIEAIVRLE